MKYYVFDRNWVLQVRFDLHLDSSNAIELREKYITAAPFPHIVLDDIIQTDYLNLCYERFPKPDSSWWVYDNSLEKKFAKNDLEQIHPILKALVLDMMTNKFVDALEKLTGISGLIVDHTLNGGGLHQIPRSGKLDIHADYNYHPITKLDRRINVLLYLNPNWDSKWGGNLELWNKDMTQCVQSIEPKFNRMVIFSTTDTAYHGHPEPLQCPDGITRKSIAMYYYTNGRPESECTEPHSTIFKRRPQDPINEEQEHLRVRRALRRV